MATQPPIEQLGSRMTRPGPDHDPLGGTGKAAHLQQLYNLECDLDYRIDRYRKEGKNPLDLFDPSKSDYAGKPEALLPYALAALRQALEERARQVRSAAAASAEKFVRKATPAELASARDALGQGADHRHVVARFNARGINFSEL